MKNVIKHSKKGFLMVTLFATLLSFANEVSFYTIKNDAKRTSLTLKNVKQGNLLSIKDDNGIVLYKEIIQKTGVYTNGFDLTSLPNGSYIFELDKDLEIRIVPFIVNSGNVVFDKNSEETIFKPFFRVKDDLIFVSRLNLNKETTYLEVYSGSSSYETDLELIHSEKIENTNNIEKIFKLTGIGKSTYKIVLKTDNREFTKIVN